MGVKASTNILMKGASWVLSASLELEQFICICFQKQDELSGPPK